VIDYFWHGVRRRGRPVHAPPLLWSWKDARL